MSLQVFLQVHLTGSESFLSRPDSQSPFSFFGRCAWLSLFCEVFPRALLAEMRLSPMLLGSSSAEQFLLVLAEDDIPRASELLVQAAAGVRELSAGALELTWTSTENLGSWPIARKRLDDALALHAATPLAERDPAEAFQPREAGVSGTGDDRAPEYFAAFAEGQMTATSVGYTVAEPGRLVWNGGQFSWPLLDQSDAEQSGILFPRRVASDDDGKRATPQEVADRAEGTKTWGILAGDADQFGTLLKAVGTVEEHIQLSLLLKEFFAGELSLLCTMPDFWRKVTVLYRGGDDFVVMGAWDALLALARELQRLYERFAEGSLHSTSATLSLALAVAPQADASVESVYHLAALDLRKTKAAEAGTFSVFGRVLEPKRLADAEELKASLMRLVNEFGFAPEYIHNLASVYREAPLARSVRRKTARVDKPWRTYMRLASVIPQARGKELNNVRNNVIASLIGKRTASLKLRPSGRVGLEWARLASGGTE